MTSNTVKEHPYRASMEIRNPLMEGFSLAASEAELFPLIARNPFQNNAWLEKNQDISLFKSYMSTVVAPTIAVVDLGLAIHQALKIVLHQKNPELPQNQQTYFLPPTLPDNDFFLHPSHVGVVQQGITCLGKSHALVAALRTIPQVLIRKNVQGLAHIVQINWLLLDITTIASIEALAEQIVRQIDDLLCAKGEIFETTFRGVRAASAKMERALRLLTTHFVGIVAVDEIQPNNFAKPGAEALRDWFLRMANQRIALVFSGNPLGFRLTLPKTSSTEEVTQTQLLRRLFANREIRRDPATSVDDPNWIRFIKTIATCHLDGSKDPFNMEHERLKLHLTGGFEGFYIELHCQLEIIRYKNPSRPVDKAMIVEAASASTELKTMRTLISAFVEKDPIKLRRCSDVDHQYFVDKWHSPQEKQKESEARSNGAPTTLVMTTPISADPVKAIQQDKVAIERRSKARNTQKSTESSPLKNSVLAHHRDELNAMISGNKSADEKR